MTTKLHINISQGVIDIEGEPDLVREIYSDFKDQLLNRRIARDQPHIELNEVEESDVSPKPRVKTKRKTVTRNRSKGAEESSDVNADAPKLDRNLDTSKLAAFYSQFKPRNHPEKILIFLYFLIDEVKIEHPNTDQVYTCYVKADQRIPKAFAQAFRDTSGKKCGYIDYKSSTDMQITTAGRNHFNFDIKKTVLNDDGC
ncbi:hypothetical protein [Gluconobacter potus]|uniref:hypothetical protein n=1 Tax=Gluconobacter potus TaxID=2724927 RepID=UPI0039EA8824